MIHFCEQHARKGADSPRPAASALGKSPEIASGPRFGRHFWGLDKTFAMLRMGIISFFLYAAL